MNDVTGDALPYPTAFKRSEEKCAVFSDRPAERAPELILIELRFCRVEESLRVQNLIPEILIHVSVPLIRSRLRHHVHDRARIPPVLCIKRIADDAKFFDSVWRRLNRRQVHKLIVRVTAVDAEIIGAIAAAIHRYGPRTIASIKRSAARSQLRLHARLQLQELISVARI